MPTQAHRLADAIEAVTDTQFGSVNMLKRKLGIGFSDAGQLMDMLYARGVVGVPMQQIARAVLLTRDEGLQLASRVRSGEVK